MAAKRKKKPTSRRQYFKPMPYAVAYGCPNTTLTVRKFPMRLGNGAHTTWANLFDGRKQVWDCNGTFFNAHFVKVNP